MAQQSTTAPSCKDSQTFLSRLKRLLPTGSDRSQQINSKLPTFLATVASVALVVASAGLGSFYAWSVGSPHGTLLACLFVLFAAGLEIAKPLAVSASLGAFRSWSVVRGLALAALALVAISYSLTAELSLTAITRGDLVASREASIRSDNDAEADRRRAAARYDSAAAELAALPSSRPAKELQAEIDGLLLRPGANGCVMIDGRVTREVCPHVADLKKELARAERRTELEAIIATPLPTATAKIENSQHAKDGDPGATALATYLAFFGITIAPAVLSEWLVLVPVLALEIGSAFAGILVQSFAGSSEAARAVQTVKAEVVQPRPVETVQAVVHPANTGTAKDVDQAREKVKTAIVSQLRAQGGSVSGGERGLAKLIGANRSTMRRAINGLVLAGVVVAEATRNGTMLRLVA